MARYANVIVDISHEKLDKTFQYQIPEELQEKIVPGVAVTIPFGNRSLLGYVLELTDEAEIEIGKIKPILSIVKDQVPIEAELITLAAWIRRNYGGTMNQALKAVIPVRRQKKAIERKTLYLDISIEEALHKLAVLEQRHATAQARLLRELIQRGSLDQSIVVEKLSVSPQAIRSLKTQGVLRIEVATEYRNPVGHLSSQGKRHQLNEEQQMAFEAVRRDMDAGRTKTYLLKGVTGSGKTEVYMEMIAHAIAMGKQAIVLIPEIALTYQTVMRFYERFGDRVSILNSRLSEGERYDQYLRAKNGDVDIMIGPRSALFTPFSQLGLIIVDEEHETSYKSESVPRYHARETAIARAGLCGASVVLGSATPSMESYQAAKEGRYELLELKERVQKRPLPDCEVIDLREELRLGNRSILSLRLQEAMEARLKKKEQVMLFLNRRGVAGFVSCRSCGHVIRCPHCDVSLSWHNNGRMVCHYCGYEEAEHKVCPECGSRYIGAFKAGTQKIEQIVKERFPGARVLRMDADTTRTKDSYEAILSAFANQEADILIGTQMIVKGHDFSKVTLVGILAADMSLHVNDFHGPERTFQLLTQAAGRAGRGEMPGEVIIQTYDPTHYAIACAKDQDYERFFEQEMVYRTWMNYPPAGNLLVILLSAEKEAALDFACGRLFAFLQRRRAQEDLSREEINLLGPANATIARISDIYRKVIYIKTADYDTLVALKEGAEWYLRDNKDFYTISVQFDFNPVSGF